jgi:hypothetical protein
MQKNGEEAVGICLKNKIIDLVLMVMISYQNQYKKKTFLN